MNTALAERCGAARLLLVEDSPGDADLTCDLLAEGCDVAAFSVVRVPRLSEALDLLRHERVQAVVLDLRLPDAEGLEGLDRLRQAAPDLPVVVLTGLADEAVAVESLQRGAQDFVVKGHLAPSVFARTVRNAIERHRIKRELDDANVRLRDVNTRLEHLSVHDPLTELLNRRGLQQALSREQQRRRRQDSGLFLLLIDLDNFKQINDSLGYSVGDLALRTIAGKLKGALRPTDHPARIGGDEFMVLLPNTRPAEGARIAERVRLAISESALALVSGGNARVTASVGALTVSEAVASIEELLSVAHLILRRSKIEGKNRVVYGADAVDEAAFPLADVRRALHEGNQLMAVKQPIVRLADRSVMGVELLSRMVAGVFALPDDFFRVALESNLLTVADHRCFRNCLAAATFIPPDLRCHVNLFPSTLLDIPVPKLIEELPAHRPTHAWCIEISEKQIIGDPAYLLEAVETFRRHGVRIAMDDVGFGRSCLETLIVLEPDVVKIDRGCVTGVGSDPARERHLQRLLKVARAVDTEIIAEGVETREDVVALSRLGVPYAQGYHFGQPA